MYYNIHTTKRNGNQIVSFHYYGARYYWSEVMTGWLSVGPMMDKYPSVSPYAYCAWNPVKLVDPNGEEAVVLGGSSANVALPQSADKQWTMLSIGFSLSVGPQFGVGVSAGAQVGGTKPLAPEIPTHPRTFADRFLNKYTHKMVPIHGL